MLSRFLLNQENFEKSHNHYSYMRHCWRKRSAFPCKFPDPTTGKLKSVRLCDAVQKF